MTERRQTTTVKIGSVTLGSSAPVALQSMTKVQTTDIDLCLEQVRALARAGCELVRIAVPTRSDTAAFAKIVPNSPVPLVADIHFSCARALEAIEAGAAKIRLNPGNIKDPADIARIIDAAKAHNTAIRVGVNEASIRDLSQGDVDPGQRAKLMADKMADYVDIFEKSGFDQLVLSAKSVDVPRTIEVNRVLAQRFDYPLHLGLTHAGLPGDAAIPSAAALGTLLAEGIGDTIRVSAAGDPVTETLIGKELLCSLGLRPRTGPELIVCPTCGRAQLDVVQLAKQVKTHLAGIKKHVRVAVMGCIVNGPGEAADADLAICAGKNKAALFVQGQKTAVVAREQIIPAMLAELKKLA